MSDVLPVVRIATSNGPVEINRSDYDPAIHTLAEGEPAPPPTAAPPAPVGNGKSLGGVPSGPPVDPNALRDDGPTVEEYVAAGYLAVNYPPAGYASRSTPEAIKAAIAATTPAPPPPSNPNIVGTIPAKGSRMIAQLKPTNKFYIVDASGEKLSLGGYASADEAQNAEL